jgi:homocysteine S-methyltransferase
MEASTTPSAYDALSRALAARRCVILDGRAGSGRERALDAHRLALQAGCDVVTTSTRGLFAPADPGGGPVQWTDSARRAMQLARQAIAEQGREGQAAVAFAIDPGVDGPDGDDTIRLLGRVLADDPPDILHLEGLSAVRPSLYATVEALLALGLPLWLSFRRCRHGRCDAYGQHWGDPQGDGFGRAAQRFEALGVGALLVGCVPPDHVSGVISHLREFTDLPLGVAPNLGYLTVDGWETEGSLVRMARGWRDEGAELIGGCCGVGPEHIAALSAALAGA